MNDALLTDLPPQLLDLIPSGPLMELGPGEPNESLAETLDTVDLEHLFAPHTIADHDMAAACHSGLWLAHNFLDESHTLSQSIDTSTGSYWHGIMHRREPDFSNAKYWFRKVSDHAIFDDLGSAATTLAQEHGTCPQSEFLTRQATWDPMAFIDLCEWVARGGSEAAELCQRVARTEWEILMRYSYEQAIGG